MSVTHFYALLVCKETVNLSMVTETLKQSNRIEIIPTIIVGKNTKVPYRNECVKTELVRNKKSPDVLFGNCL